MSRPRLAATGLWSHLPGMTFDLTDEETEALLRELNNLIDGDRYQFSARVRTLKAIRAKMRPESAREPQPPPAEAICPAAGERSKETARRALIDRLCQSACGRVRMKIMANSEPIAVRLQKICIEASRGTAKRGTARGKRRS
jgi:hypothetical protein